MLLLFIEYLREKKIPRFKLLLEGTSKIIYYRACLLLSVRRKHSRFTRYTSTLTIMVVFFSVYQAEGTLCLTNSKDIDNFYRLPCNRAHTELFWDTLKIFKSYPRNISTKRLFLSRGYKHRIFSSINKN